MLIELHCHSTCSDGSEPAAAVAAAAAARGVELFCLTDHDTCAGHAATAAIAERGVTVLRGVEVSCTDGKRNVHVLFYDAAPARGAWADLEAALATSARARRERVRVICARLWQRGIVVDAERILAAAGDRVVGRPDVARALVETGVVATMQDAFRRYLHDGGPADANVAGSRIALPDALALGRAVGARMSLAHPHQHGDASATLLRRHRADGLDGVEAIYGQYDRRERARWLELAAALDLTVTAGSDFHGTSVPAITAPGIELDEPHAARLREWLGLG